MSQKLTLRRDGESRINLRRVGYDGIARDLKIAIVHDWLITYGGAERVFERILRLFPQADLFAMRHDVANLYLDPKLNNYIVDLVQATRNPQPFDADLARWCRFGASPRASIALARCARTKAWMDGEKFVAPHHIQAVAPEILRHRILLTFEGEAEGITTDSFVTRLLDLVAIP